MRKIDTISMTRKMDSQRRCYRRSVPVWVMVFALLLSGLSVNYGQAVKMTKNKLPGKTMNMGSHQFRRRVLSPEQATTLGRKAVELESARQIAARKQTNWQWMSPLPQGDKLSDIVITKDNRLIAVGDNGTIITSQSGGQTWSVQNFVGGAYSIDALRFTDDQTAFAVGSVESDTSYLLNSLILKTTNTGMTWQTVTTGNTPAIHAISFATGIIGYTAGERGMIMKTTDAGNTWSPIEMPTAITYEDIYAIDSLKIIAVGHLPNGVTGNPDGIISRSSDGGKSWSTTNIGGNCQLFTVAFSSASSGVAAGQNGVLYSTTDGGVSWQEQNSDAESDIYSVCFVDTKLGFFTGADGIIRETNNAGQTWTELFSGTSYYLYRISFSTPLLGVAVGEAGMIIKTTDGGNSWQTLTKGITEHIKSLCFKNATTGYAAATHFDGSMDNGSVYKTTDGGNSWQSAYHNSDNVQLLSIACHDSTLLLSAGYPGVILRSTNEGTDWSQIENSFSDYSLNHISIADSGVCYISGEYSGSGGVILKTTDYGLTWQSVYSSEQNNIWSIQFLSPKIGFAVGYGISDSPDHGLILSTTNGGATWNTVLLNVESGLTDIHFTDLAHGCVVGKSVYTTTDGGSSWQAANIPIVDLFAVNFYDMQNGTAVGWPGEIYNTTDGGQNWIAQKNFLATQNLESVLYVPNGGSQVGYIGGEGGVILVSAVSPMRPRTWVWGGSVDSSWNNSLNWTPIGVPLPGDSVIIAPAKYSAVINKTQQQIVIGSLWIQSGGALTITDSLKRFVVLGDVKVNGTLELPAGTQTSIISGGSWFIAPGGEKALRKSTTDLGFIPGNSTVSFTQEGLFADKFYNVVIDSNAVMQSNGRITVQNKFVNLNLVNLAAKDTVYISGNEPQALLGKGKFTAGTIRRNIKSGATEKYQFESGQTYVQFYKNSPFPQYFSMTTYPNTDPAQFGAFWIELPSRIDTLHHVVYADSVSRTGTYSIGVTGSGEKAKKGIIRVCTGHAGSNKIDSLLFAMSLRYEASEVPQGTDINSFKLLRLVDSTQAAMLRPVLDSAKFESGKVLLGWHGSLVNVSGFYVQRKSGDSTSARPFTTIATLSKSASGYVDTTRQDSVKVTYQVLAFNQYGISDASNRIVVSVKPSDVNSPEQKKQYNYALEQNYPNPFNPATQITYQLATACPVVLQLFDILGREVAVLVNAEQKAGIYKVALNLENYSSGIYFYTLQAGTFRSTKKMLFLK